VPGGPSSQVTGVPSGIDVGWAPRWIAAFEYLQSIPSGPYPAGWSEPGTASPLRLLSGVRRTSVNSLRHGVARTRSSRLIRLCSAWLDSGQAQASAESHSAGCVRTDKFNPAPCLCFVMRHIDARCWTTVRIAAYGAVGGGLRTEDAAHAHLPSGPGSCLLSPSLTVRDRKPAAV